ncbi:MAG: type II toxin-antitoxin system VapC family toxin [Isosphaeraceae bacterium]
MTLLLDTHAFLWFCQDDPLLSTKARALIEDAGNRKVVSVASCWEIAIKAGLGKLKLGESSATYLPSALSRTGFEVLPISVTHATSVESMPLHHRDPFDRLLVAQAAAEGIPVVSNDSQFDAYGVIRLW